jgi:cytochrome b
VTPSTESVKAGKIGNKEITMADHKHGEMDTSVQEKTFDGFVKFTSWSVAAIVVFLFFLALVGT